MKWTELAEWVKATKKLDEQVEMFVEEDEPNEADFTIEGIGPVFNAPFVGYTSRRRDEASSHIHIGLWESEYHRPYTWQQLLNWLNTVEDGEATALAAWHLLHLKPISEDKLYAYEVNNDRIQDG
jgi:hypothetical protein